MKKQSNYGFNQLETRDMDILTTIVSETIFTAFRQPKGKTFTPAELWNIQRRGVNSNQRRRFI